MKPQGKQTWTAEDILALGRSYQGAAVLAAAADLDLFTVLALPATRRDQRGETAAGVSSSSPESGEESKTSESSCQVRGGPATAAALSRALDCDRRGLTVLLDALVALRLLEKSGDLYSLPPGLEAFLTPEGAESVLAMAQHQAHCLRNWAQLARVVKTGHPAECMPSVRGQSGDQESFIGAMHNISAPGAAQVIQAVQPLQFRHLLDIGGASGTWTIAFLHACPTARATLFDLPHVIPMAQQRLAAEGLSERVKLVAGDFMADPLPPGADLAWVSAIAHQNSRAQNRLLFTKVFAALEPGGRIALRDMLMDSTRTRPVAGALFAVNMLVATEGGGTFTFEELREDLESAGFAQATVLRQDEAMNSIVVARKPEQKQSQGGRRVHWR